MKVIVSTFRARTHALNAQAAVHLQAKGASKETSDSHTWYLQAHGYDAVCQTP